MLHFLDFFGKAFNLNGPGGKCLFLVFHDMQLRQQRHGMPAQFYIDTWKQRHRPQDTDDTYIYDIADQNPQKRRPNNRHVMRIAQKKQNRDIDHHRRLINDKIRPQNTRSVTVFDSLLFKYVRLTELSARGTWCNPAEKRSDKRIAQPLPVRVVLFVTPGKNHDDLP